MRSGARGRVEALRENVFVRLAKDPSDPPSRACYSESVTGRSGEDGKNELTDEVLEACAVSLWEFDRICFYLVQEHDASADIERLVRDVEQEFEHVRAVDGGGSLVPLYYALRALKANVWARELSATSKDELMPLLTSIVRIITRYRLDPGAQVSDIIADLQSRLGQDERMPSAKAAIRAVATSA